MELHSLFLKHPIISIDSRNCPKDSLFFALKGDNFNANAFALSALENGSSFAIIDEAQYAIDERFILVNNVLETLQNLAAFHRRYIGTKIIGITGTNGKTTTKELIASVLKEKFNTLYTQGNLNNHIGVPLTLLQLKPEHEMAVIEMGANHPGEINLLANIAQPDFGIITNVGKAHLEGFGSFEGVKKTKAELYGFVQKSGTGIFLHLGNEHLVEMAQELGFSPTSSSVITYSMDENIKGRVNGKILDCSPFLSLICQSSDDKFTINTHLIGSYNAENILAAVTIGLYFGVNSSEIKHGLENYIPQNNRSQLTITDRNKLVVDAYNANPTSMRAAILNFAQMNVASKALILGDMLELGEQSSSEHQSIIDLLVSNQLETVYLVGSEFCKTRHSFCCFDKVQLLVDYLKENPINNHYILIKGSRGIKLEKTLEIL